MNAVAETLFLPLTTGLVRPDARAHVVFMNAAPHPYLSQLDRQSLTLQQYFKPLAAALEAGGYQMSADLPETRAAYDLGLLLFPKNIIEGTNFVARMAGVLKEGATLICAADNKAGGMRLKKVLQQFGFINIQEISKNKARVVWGNVSGLLPEILRAALDGGSLHLTAHGFASQPGLFAWDRIDKGSGMLTQYLPQDLKGAGADFGCGYGYLSHHVLQNCPGVSSLHCIDADARAISAARENLKKFNHHVEYQWHDLTQPYTKGAFDWIVMNPPFHEGDKTSVAAGESFIRNAHTSLKTGGELWMVANAHLPYERTLRELFSVQKIAESGGFKVYRAKK